MSKEIYKEAEMNIIMGLLMIAVGIFLSRYVENDMGMLIVSLWLIAGTCLASLPTGTRRRK